MLLQDVDALLLGALAESHPGLEPFEGKGLKLDEGLVSLSLPCYCYYLGTY